MKASIIESPGGNKGSVKSWLQRAGIECKFVSDSSAIYNSNLVVFPGNGTFSETIDWIEKKSLKKAILDYVESKKLYIGICIGMQIMFEIGLEGGEKEGLGILEGVIQKLKVPRIGWKKVYFNSDNLIINSDYYFMHQYGFLENSNCLDFLKYKNSFLFQFHPEKSGASGDKLLKKILDNYV